jgi:hypothetical protein
MYKALENLYSQVLISEMNQAVIDYIDEHKEYLPFHDIFGEQLRIVIPLTPDQIGLEIIDALSEIEGYQKLTPDHEVSRKIKLDPKYGKGDYKIQLIAVGKAIQSLKIPNELKSKYLDWYALNKNSLYELQFFDEDMKILNEYVIVLSRAPVDIVRMSDGDWGFSPGTYERSCHNSKGSFFKCALQEAISGGAIAFLVKKEDIQDAIDNDRFQESDLFEDDDRGITGPKPTTRLRIRMLDVRMPTETNKHNIQQIAVPETRIYGNSKIIPNFYRTVKNYIRKAQPYSADELMDAIGEGGRERISLRGGTQNDNNMDTLLNKLYDNKVEFNPNIYHNQSDSSNERDLNTDEFVDEVDQEAIAEEQKDQLESELDYIENRYLSVYHSGVGYYADISWDDAEPYVYYDANGHIVIDLDSDYETDTDFPDDIESYHLYQLRARNGNTSNLSRFGNGDNIAKLKKFIQALDQYDPTGELLDCTDSIRNDSSSQMIFNLKFNGGNGMSSDSSDYKDFIEDVVNMLDEQYDGIKKAIQKALLVSGYIETSDNVDYSEPDDAQDFLDQLEYVEFENNVISINISIPIDKRNRIRLPEFDGEFTTPMGNFLVNYLTSQYKPTVQQDQLEFSNLYERF